MRILISEDRLTALATVALLAALAPGAAFIGTASNSVPSPQVQLIVATGPAAPTPPQNNAPESNALTVTCGDYEIAMKAIDWEREPQTFPVNETRQRASNPIGCRGHFSPEGVFRCKLAGA